MLCHKTAVMGFIITVVFVMGLALPETASAEIYDHFLGTSLDTATKWYTWGNGTAAVGSSTVTVSSSAGNQFEIYSQTVWQRGTYVFNITTSPSAVGQKYFGLCIGNDRIYMTDETGQGEWRLEVVASGNWSYSGILDAPVAGDRFEIQWTHDYVHLVKNGTVIASETTNVPAVGNAYVSMRANNGGSISFEYVARSDYVIGRGRRLTLDQGLLTEASTLCGTDGPTAGEIALWNGAHFSAINFQAAYDESVPMLANISAGTPWGRWYQPEYSENSHWLYGNENNYASSFKSFRFWDERSTIFEDQDVYDEVIEGIHDYKETYQNAIAYTNFSHVTPDNANTLYAFLRAATPDMLSFDGYPTVDSNGGMNEANRTEWYGWMLRYRLAGLWGMDGWYTEPVPYAQHLNLTRECTGTVPYEAPDPWSMPLASESYVRLQQFASWAFGFTRLFAFKFYFPVANWEDSETHYITRCVPMMFDEGASWDKVGNTNAAYTACASANVESARLGPALIRLVNTDIRMKIGTAYTSTPITAWTSKCGGTGDMLYSVTPVTGSGSNTTSGSYSDILIGYFKPLKADNSGYEFADGLHFMIVNGASVGTASASAQYYRLEFDFTGTSYTGIKYVSRTQDNTVSTVPKTAMTRVGTTNRYRWWRRLPGGTGELIKFY